MIRLQDGEMADLLPPYLSNQIDVIALSYAFKMAMNKMLTFASRTRLYADIDRQTEDVIDLMAIELNASYYDMDMDLDTKRNIIKNALYLRMRAGTKSALRDLINLVYKSGDILEWFEFDGVTDQDIGKFDVITSESSEQDSYDKVLKLIRQTKSASAHLRKVEYTREIPVISEGIGVVLSQYSESRLMVSEEGYMSLNVGNGMIISQYSEMIIPVMD